MGGEFSDLVLSRKGAERRQSMVCSELAFGDALPQVIGYLGAEARGFTAVDRHKDRA